MLKSGQQMTSLFFYIILILIPLSWRRYLYMFTSGFSEYTVAWFYLADVSILIFIALMLFKNKPSIPYYLIAVGIAFFLPTLWATNVGLAIYGYLRIAILILLAVAVATALKKKIIDLEKIWGVLGLLGVVEAIIAIGQFKTQGSLGLGMLGEPVVDLMTVGVSYIPYGAIKVLRAYGTFLHPNILAGFLIISILSLLYFFIKGKGLREKIWLTVGLYILFLGLILTFSRGALIALGAGLGVMVLGILIRRKIMAGIMLSIFMISLFLTAGWPVKDILLPRIEVRVDEPAVRDRVSYLEISQRMLVKKPLGVGLNNFVIAGYDLGLYKDLGLKRAWEWQPAHSIYLLVFNETGVLGGIIFLIMIIGLLYKRIKIFLKEKISSPLSQNLLILSIAIAVFIAGLFDHFWWTIGAGQIIWWLIIGLLLVV